MTVKIIGKISDIPRLKFEMWSFDLAFSDQEGHIGFPIGGAVEISGAPSVGKSTTTYGIAGYIGKVLKQDISLFDLEGFSPPFLTSVLDNVGFDGTVRLIQEPNDEESLEALLAHLRDKKERDGVGIIDSVGAISPISEAEGELGEANMGRRAKLMTSFMRKIVKVNRDNIISSPKTTFLINHQLPNIGSRGVNTPGGEAIKYLSIVRIRMSRKEEFPDKSYVIEGKVIKNRFGYKDTVFHFVNLSGKGIHWGLSWMYDGFLQKGGRIVRDRGKVKIDGEKYCMLKEAFIEAHNGNNDFFLPFRDAVYSINANPEILVEESEEVDGDTETEDTITDAD